MRLESFYAVKNAMEREDLEEIESILDSFNSRQIVNTEDVTKKTLLFHACVLPSQDFALRVADLLIRKGANIFHLQENKQTILYYLASTGKARFLERMFENGFNQAHLNQNDYTKQTPIFYAASKNQLKCAELLIRHGANVNHIDSNGQNCIFWAASHGHEEMCKLLVNRNTNFSQIDNNRETPLHYAKKNKHRNIVEYFSRLKKSIKKQKDDIKMESSQQESRGKARTSKKQMLKQEYCLVFTNQFGEVHELTEEELIKFGNQSEEKKRIYEYMMIPEKMEHEPMREDKRFEKIANKILTFFQKHENGIHFLEPIDIEALKIPHYPKIVSKPMDFSTIKTKLTLNAYDSETDFYDDMCLVFDNCMLFNGRESSYGRIAFELKCEFDSMYKRQFP